MPEEDAIDRFIREHEMVQAEIDSKGFKGYCATSEAIKERLGLSDEDLKRHYELFAIDEYIVQPDPDKNVSCSRDAIRVIKEKLETALK